MAGGRGFGDYTKGERIKNIAEVTVGALLLEHSTRFDADNTILVTHEFDARVWAHFVNPHDWTERWGMDFCIWDFELEREIESVQLWRAVPKAITFKQGEQNENPSGWLFC